MVPVLSLPNLFLSCSCAHFFISTWPLAADSLQNMEWQLWWRFQAVLNTINTRIGDPKNGNPWYSEVEVREHHQTPRTSQNICEFLRHEGTPMQRHRQIWGWSSLIGSISWKACGGHGSWIWKRKSSDAKSETEHPQPNPTPVRSRAKSHMVLFFRSNLVKNS